mmetsp:Transcript_17753/g.21547  ORF Transcript_17753/g.21547 Transcript_17753/m.21547 type:complete len:376 (+) Transcript_17753:132-1259(+)|eukprot:CAMPEP_0184035326 /NCGR_PEP_ID=MMETSP0955-20130417/25274_1 /TAXON_ID=627963 /ORGANISM="Aplanochytrium sp, Strain PBS07" /LENGTH=375 /DNA_ID=CAMNT_0026322441 /DNA_START=47 /DNA_END=1174 /DNA_ORIENTATION=+
MTVAEFLTEKGLPTSVVQNYKDWEGSNADTCVSEFKSCLETLRNSDLAEEQKAQRNEVVLGVNWLGVELFARLTGLMGKKPCREEVQWIVNNVVIPITSSTEEEILEMMFGVEIAGVPVVGVMNTFHSYTWGEAIQDTLKSVRGSLIGDKQTETKYFWWDIFCQNQHHVGNVVETFDTAVNQCSDFAMTIPDPSNPRALRRVWCLFEVMTAEVKEKKIEIMCNPTLHIKNADSEIDIREAGATIPEDKPMILGLVEERIEGGAEALNTAVRKILVLGMHRARIMRKAGKSGDKETKILFAETNLGFKDIKQRLIDHGTPRHQLKGMGKAELIHLAKALGVNIKGKSKAEAKSGVTRRMERGFRGKMAAFRDTSDI